MKKLLLLLLLPSFLFSQEELILRCKQPLSLFIIAKKNDTLPDYDTMQTIFSSMSLSAKKLRRSIRNDIIRCGKYIRNHKKNSQNERDLLAELRSCYKYIKEHQHCCNAISFHNKLRLRYAQAFNNPNIVNDIETKPELYGLSERCLYKCRTYFKRIVKDLTKIEKFEDLLHGDHSVLKAHNHSFKIELIRLRNTIYHNNIYKFETRYF